MKRLETIEEIRKWATHAQITAIEASDIREQLFAFKLLLTAILGTEEREKIFSALSRTED